MRCRESTTCGITCDLFTGDVLATHLILRTRFQWDTPWLLS